MQLIYAFGMYLFVAFLYVAQFFNSKIKEGIHGRKDWKKQLNTVPKNKKIIWFHCASLGEFDQGLPVMNQLKATHPDFFLVVTFFSPSGMKHCHKRLHQVDLFLYLPFDTQANARLFLEKVHPSIAVFVKYEFWPNFIRETAKRSIPIVSISTLLRANQVYFKWYGSFFANTLRKINLFCVQNESTKELLAFINCNECIVTGDTRFDRVEENKAFFLSKFSVNQSTDFEIFERFLQGEKAIILGSSWPAEEAILNEALQALSDHKIIIAPHDVSEAHIRNLESIFAKKAIRFTQFDTFQEQQILILDTIGHLASAYYFGKMAFVGGGFSGSLHNILEPAVFGLPTCFGPKHSKFPEAKLFLEKGFSTEIQTAKDFIDFVQGASAISSESILLFMQDAQGATQKNILAIEKVI